MAADFPTRALGAPGRNTPRRVEALAILRSARRSLGFALALAAAGLEYLGVCCFARRGSPALRRAQWLHRLCRGLVRIFGVEAHHDGVPPRSGLLVSNHLSYLDIVVFSAAAPCVFIAKKDVAGWPVFGAFAQMAGTIFVDRSRRLEVAEANHRIAAALATGTVVVLFAEGTSSDGQAVLPFCSPLLAAAALARCPVAPAAIGYQLDDGSVADEVCYWRDMTLLPHLLKLFSKRRIRARVAFGAGSAIAEETPRKQAARQLHREVSALHAGLESTAW